MSALSAAPLRTLRTTSPAGSCFAGLANLSTPLRRVGVLATCGVACLGRSGDQDVESDAHGGIEERRRGRRQRTEGHEILEVPGARDVLADVDGPVAVRDVGDDDVQPLPAGQARVDERAGQVETVELTYGNEGTTYPPPSRYLRPHLPRPRGRRAWRRAPGGRLPGAGG